MVLDKGRMYTLEEGGDLTGELGGMRMGVGGVGVLFLFLVSIVDVVISDLRSTLLFLFNIINDLKFRAGSSLGIVILFDGGNLSFAFIFPFNFSCWLLASTSSAARYLFFRPGITIQYKVRKIQISDAETRIMEQCVVVVWVGCGF